MSCGHSRDDVLHVAHRVSGSCSPARSSRPSWTGGHPSTPSRSSAPQIGGEPHVRRDASLLPSAPRAQTGAPPQSSVLHIWEPSVEHEGDRHPSTDEKTPILHTVRKQYTAPGFGPWHPGHPPLSYAGQYGVPYEGQSSFGVAGTSRGQGQSFSVRLDLQTSYLGGERSGCGFPGSFITDMIAGGNLLGMSQLNDIDVGQTQLGQSQLTGAPSPTQRSPYLIRTDTRSSDRLTYPTGYARCKTRTRTQTQRAESGSDE